MMHNWQQQLILRISKHKSFPKYAKSLKERQRGELFLDDTGSTFEKTLPLPCTCNNLILISSVKKYIA